MTYERCLAQESCSGDFQQLRNKAKTGTQRAKVKPATEIAVSFLSETDWTNDCSVIGGYGDTCVYIYSAESPVPQHAHSGTIS